MFVAKIQSHPSISEATTSAKDFRTTAAPAFARTGDFSSGSAVRSLFSFFSFLSFVCGGINLVTGSVHFRVGSNMRWMGSIWIYMDLYYMVCLKVIAVFKAGHPPFFDKPGQGSIHVDQKLS